MLLAGLVVIVVAVHAVEPSRASETTGFRVVGKIPLTFDPGTNRDTRSQTGWFVTNPTTRRGYMFNISTTVGSQDGRALYVQSYDLDTLKPLRRRTIAGPIYPLTTPTGGNFNGTALFHALDERGGRIFLPVSGSSDPNVVGSLGAGVDAQRPFQSLIIINEAKFASDLPDAQVFANRRTLGPTEAPLVQVHSLNGLQYFETGGTGKLLTLWADMTPGGLNGAAQKNHQLMQWGVDGNSADDWTRPTLLTAACGRARLNGAGDPSKTMYQLGILRGPSYIAIACQKSEGAAHVVRIQLDATGAPHQTPVVETYTLGRRYGDTIADQRGERLFVRSLLQGNSWWAFDARQGVWAGAVGVAAGDNGLQNSAGLDPDTGRLYSLMANYYYTNAEALVPVTGGFGFTDTRLTPVPQLQVVNPELAYPGRYQIEVDPAREGRPRRLFVRRGKLNELCFKPNSVTEYEVCDAEAHYLVLEDREPIATKAASEDVDRYTTNVAEQEGVTAANFDRSASGFGSRFLSIAGVSGAVNRDLDPGSGGSVSHGSPCPPIDREMVVGEVASAQANNSTASAHANSIRLDEATLSQIDDPVKQCWPTPWFGGVKSTADAPDQRPRPPEIKSASISCTGDQRKDTSVAGPPVQTAEAICRQAEGEFDVGAKTDSLTLGDLTVASSFAHSWVAIDSDHPERGLVTHVDAVAQGVRLGSYGTIGSIRSTTRVWSGGRPGTAKGEYERHICQVDVSGAMKDSGCLNDEQQRSFVARFNQSMAGNAELRLRNPDAAYQQGTPGGYQAAIQRDRREQFVDRIMTRDDSKALPALELIIYRDDGAYGAAREVAQFAATEAASQYGIYCLYGETSSTSCGTEPGLFGLGPTPSAGPLSFGGGLLNPPAEVDRSTPSSPGPKPRPSLIERVRNRIANFPADVMRLILSGPKELLLTAGVWMMVWLPCLLGERRRAARLALASRMQGVTE
jgi:hypothetical protein